MKIVKEKTPQRELCHCDIQIVFRLNPAGYQNRSLPPSSRIRNGHGIVRVFNKEEGRWHSLKKETLNEILSEDERYSLDRSRFYPVKEKLTKALEEFIKTNKPRISFFEFSSRKNEKYFLCDFFD